MPFELGQDFVPRPVQKKRRERNERRLAELHFKWFNAVAAGDTVAALTAALDWDELAAQVYGEDFLADLRRELAHEPANDD
jgi:hypothetical protein